MTSLTERIQHDIKDAMKARDSDRTTALRMFVSALQSESKNKLRPLEEAEEVAVLQRERKKRVEAAEAFEQAGASERAEAERAQQRMLDAYLPQQMTAAELDAIVLQAVQETGANNPSQMGMVMKALMPKVQGRADGKVVSESVKRALAGADTGGD